MTIGCNIWMICLKLNWFFYGQSHMLQFSEFVWALSYSVWDVFNNFLLIDATDRSKFSGDQKRFFIALSLYPFHFSRTLPLTNFPSGLSSREITNVRILFYSFPVAVCSLNNRLSLVNWNFLTFLLRNILFILFAFGLYFVFHFFLVFNYSCAILWQEQFFIGIKW